MARVWADGGSEIGATTKSQPNVFNESRPPFAREYQQTLEEPEMEFDA